MATASLKYDALSKSQDDKLEAFAFVLKLQIQDLRVRLSEEIQRHMEMISSTADIRSKQDIIKSIVGIKQALEPIAYYSTRVYHPPTPPDLESMEYIINKDEVRKLFDFFQAIHFTLFEIRMKLCHIYDHLSMKGVAVEYLSCYAVALKQVKELSIQLEEL